MEGLNHGKDEEHSSCYYDILRWMMDVRISALDRNKEKDETLTDFRKLLVFFGTEVVKLLLADSMW
jgi:hypothetical protein